MDSSVQISIRKPNMTVVGHLQANQDSNGQQKYVRFVGIPYAKPPVGEKRFQPPEEYEYDPERDGDPFVADKDLPFATQLVGKKMVGQEDCLYLSVYMPKKPEEIPALLPVLVNFHGGGFIHGTGSHKHRTPDSLLMHDLLVVAVNYRLGPFGFLNMRTRECQGNAGCKDQVMALRWVQDNIEAFRGNPNNVTISGESAGGSCVNFHLISPLSRNLFNKAIIMSGGIYCPWGFTGQQREMMKYFKKHYDHEHAQRVDVVKKLVAANAEFILKLNVKVVNEETDELDMNVHMGPSTEKFPEGAFLPPNISISDLMRDSKSVPILAGITEQEGCELLSSKWFRDRHVNIVKNDDEFRNFLRANLRWDKNVAKKNVPKMRKLYYGDNIKTMNELEAEECIGNLCTDLWFHHFYDNFKLGDGKESAPLYVYKFNYLTEINVSADYRKKLTGAAHGDDLHYLFCPAKLKELRNTVMTEETKQKVKTMCSLWANFCISGKPRSDYHDVEWLPHSEEEPRYLDISNKGLEMKQGRLFQKRWDLLTALIQNEPKIMSPQESPMTPDNIFCSCVLPLKEMRAIFRQMCLKKSSISPEKDGADEPSEPPTETFELFERADVEGESDASMLPTAVPGPSKPRS